MKRLGVFCGSNKGNDAIYLAQAQLLGSTLAKHQIELVYGGTSIGLMGAVADAALAAQGKVIGVIPERLAANKDMAHQGLTELRTVGSMHERKALMFELADGFIALPGGMGTFEELFECLTWAQLGYHQKPCAVLNINGFYDGLINFLGAVTEAQFMKQEHLQLLLVDSQPEALLSKMKSYQAPTVSKWITDPQP